VVYRPGIYPPELPAFAKRLTYLFLCSAVAVKWMVDVFTKPLKASDWELYLDIHIVSLLRLRRFPNLHRPKGYNDQMKWLMLFAQHQLMPVCADKIKVRAHVADTIGGAHLIPLKATTTEWKEVVPLLSQGTGVLKCTHDSGSTTLFEFLEPQTIAKLEAKYQRFLSREHGVGKGEWHYQGATRAFIVEEKLPGPAPDIGPADVKVHCVEGEPRMVHIIESRQSHSRQAFFSADGSRLKVRLKQHRGEIESYNFDVVREKVLPLAAALSAPFKYVRVDFYVIDDFPYFGELTFFEEAGIFPHPDEEQDLAAAIRINCTDPRPTLHSTLLKKNR
jgi:hypothetical protein